MTAPRRVLIVGGSGAFGSRLVDGVLATTDFHVIVGGRDRDRSAACAASRSPAHRLDVAVIDTATVTADALRATGASVVVDAAGPFQGQAYRLARAAIEAGMHAIDLADGRGFVAGIGELDADARRAQVAILTGASSTPALSNAVLDELTRGWRQIDEVDIAIVPGNRAPRGLSVVRSILSYVGQPVRIFLAGAWTVRPGWSMTRRIAIDGIGRRFVSLCETPDLDIVVSRFRVRRSVRFEAGLELAALHLGLAGAGLLVRLGVLRTLTGFAALTRRAADLLGGLGSDRGAMVVEARGVDAAGDTVRAVWTLVAEAGDGPSVPTLPALAALRALGDGTMAWRGAGPCVGVLSLDAIEREFGPLRIRSGRKTERHAAGTVFPHILGADFHGLPAPVQAVHLPGWGISLSGVAQVDGPSSVLAGLVARLFGFPRPAAAVPIHVTIDRTATGERWTRNFGGRSFVSHLRPGPTAGVLIERFGPLCFDVPLRVVDGVLGYSVEGWRLGPVRLPRVFAPVSTARESADAAGVFRFGVEIALPFRLGRIVGYRGWLVTAQGLSAGPPGGDAARPLDPSCAEPL